MKKGIRRRLMQSFLVASGVISLVVIIMTIAVSFVLGIVAESYTSNAKLKEYSDMLAEVEKNLEDYVSLRSYETINRYYALRARFDMRTLDLNRQLSDNAILQSEYVVFQLGLSFLNSADAAVYAWRAGNVSDTTKYYTQALNSYVLLTERITELNDLYFKSNVQRYNTLLKIVKKVNVRSIGFIAVIIFLNILLVYFLVSTITKPLVEISEGANRLAERDFDIPLFSYTESNEVGNICRAFNRMIISIREYIDTIWEKAIQENELREKEMKMTALYQEARLNALQTQIHPHFLFNTLNTGAQLAMMEGSDKTCIFLEQVADFYRYNLQQTLQDASLEDELRLIDTYVYIMKVRFGDRFDFLTDIRYGNLQIRIPGMTIQPLVENCIKHGFAGMTKGGKIVLSVYEEEESIYIKVADNGCGISTEVCKNLLEQSSPVKSPTKDFEPSNGVGLSNVISRLRMYFKRDDVFSISPNEGGGTIFSIRIHNVHNIIDG